ncbi:PASTA domain-containing protein [Clostridiales bacterium NSJ-32]|jgi:peptidoglycan glycosyltransferase|uniref:PASTA domain-containing protein n=2 Tax=Bianquea renquensis TaxID=2763661 RepID=A0A926DTL2_9FIRM|nr:penicillin-binding transpeptidase domain-containing protein [Bianquea renquensis]MBC8543821.1 PASTA domain-containing protein [Bianquea renquensis]
MMGVLLAIIVGLFFRIGYIQIKRGDYLQDKADKLHNRERTLEAKRGDIVDANGVVLATSASINRISVIHNQIDDAEGTARILAQELGLNYDEVLEKIQKRVALQVIQDKVDTETANRIRAYELPGVMIDENFQRYYPYGSLAAQTIGFVGSDSQGIIGLEVKYDQYLQGIDGQIQTLTDAKGREVEGVGEQKVAPVEGNTLQLSLDVTMQEYAEQLLERVLKQKNAKKGAFIVMNPQNGEIYAMANYPNFDLNDPFTINDEALAEQWDTFSQETQMDYLNQMWRNFCINDTYEPGSTFKIITASAALQEKVVSLDDTFTCTGSLTVADRRIRCAKTTGHGTQTFVQGVQNSCNPVFMTLAARLGADRFYQYLKLFQFDQKTGIDVPGEAIGIMHKLENVGPVELATMGFGQSIAITPMQLMRAASAAVNGGNLITPHFGVNILDSEGTVLKKLEFETEEGVISEDVSATMREVLGTVVSEGGGRKAYIPGYQIGGKTATSQKLPRSSKKYISSFLGFAPVSDPQVMALLLVDEPEGIYYGGTVCAPIVREYFENILPYLGIEPNYTEEELSGDDVGTFTVPGLLGKSYSEAKTLASEMGFELDVLGEGEIVMEQYPGEGEEINKDAKVVIYLE